MRQTVTSSVKFQITATVLSANAILTLWQKSRSSRLMAFTWWRYPTRRFSVDGMACEVRSRAQTDGLHSSLYVGGIEMAVDLTPLYGPDAVRNHRLSGLLPDGRALEVELGYIGAWTTGIIARLSGVFIYESHPGRSPVFPEKYREKIESQGSLSNRENPSQHSGQHPFETGVFAKHNRLPFAIDIITGLLFYFVAKATDLQTAAMLGIVVGFALILFQKITKIDVTGGLALFGIVMLCISAGLAWYLADEEWIKMRGTITGLIAASFFIIDGLRGGPYIGKGLARYMPYDDVDAGRLAFAMGLIGIIMAALNYAAAKWLSTDNWLFYTTFVDIFLVMGMGVFAMRFARKLI
jgi:intracellular septation protein A